jgi:hypothetical protein
VKEKHFFYLNDLITFSVKEMVSILASEGSQQQSLTTVPLGLDLGHKVFKFEAIHGNVKMWRESFIAYSTKNLLNTSD